MSGAPLRGLGVGIVVALTLAACGSDEEASEETGPASIVPADTSFYAEGDVRPSDTDADAIDALSSKLVGIEDPGALIIDELERAAAENGGHATYAEDIEPWLGERAGFFIGSFEGIGETESPQSYGAVLETTDEDAAQGFIGAQVEAEEGVEESSYEGVDYWLDEGVALGLVDSYMVVADEDSFKRMVDAGDGDSLAGSDQYTEAIDSVGGANQLATLYMDFGEVLDELIASGEIPADEASAAEAVFGQTFDEPLAIAAEATEDSVALEASVANPATALGGPSTRLTDAPGDAWVASGTGDLGGYLKDSLAQIEELGPQLGEPGLSEDAIAGAFEAQTGLDLEDDVLAWMGDAYVWVSGASERDLEVGFNVEASDEDAAAKALDAAREAFAQDSATTMGPPLGDTEEGFSAANRTGAGFIDAELADGELTLIYAADRAAAHLPGEDTLGSSQEFSDASALLGSDFDPAAYVSFQPLVGFIESTGEPVEPAAEQVLGALGAAVFGWRAEDDRAVARAGVTVP